jgi:Na+/melibiose symporter-like transporter
VIDWDEYMTGERKEGTYFAAWSFTSKLAAGVMLGIVGLALDWAGFVENQEQTIRVEATMLALMGAMPVVGFGVGILAFRRFSLDRQEHARIRGAIERGETPGLRDRDAHG